MTNLVKRREFITLLGGAAAAWPLAVSAQQPAMPVVGFLNSSSPNAVAEWVESFRQGLREHGYIEGQNVHIAFRWAEDRYDRLAGLAGELVRNQVKVIVATGGLPAAFAAKAATTATPIVFVASDPVQAGLVASLNRPGGNLTGVSPLGALLSAKRIGLLHDVVPKATVIGALVNPAYPNLDVQLKDAEEAALTLGLQIQVANVSSERELDAAFADLVQRRIGAILLSADVFWMTQRDLIAELAARHALPMMSHQREVVAAGGLMSYGPSFADAYRQAGVYTGRILKGEKPADLPIMQPTKFEFSINLKTAKMLGLTIPAGILAIADELIE
jgi:putative ABC transport system substrate-binding protein